MTIEDKQAEIIDEFGLFDDWLQKYEYLIEMGKSLPTIEDEFKNEEHLIKGCQSQVWLNAAYNGGILEFSADSDAIITKGIISLLIRVLSHESPSEIVKADLHFIDEIGLTEHLSPTRANGLLAMVKQMKYYALAYQSKTF